MGWIPRRANPRHWSNNRRGTCEICQEANKWLCNGLCIVCRRPLDRRELVRAGVPPGSADHLAILMQKSRAENRSQKRTWRLLSIVHPVLMQNIRITEDWELVPDVPARWIRRCGWVTEDK